MKKEVQQAAKSARHKAMHDHSPTKNQQHSYGDRVCEHFRFREAIHALSWP